MRQKILLFNTLLAMAGAAALMPALAEAPMFRGGPRLAGVFGGSTPSRLEGVRFRFDAGSPLRNAPVVANGRLFLGAADGSFYCLEAQSGTMVWKATFTSPPTSAAAVTAGMVLFTSRDNHLHALRVSDGRELWSLSLGADVGTQNYWDFYTSAPIPVAGVIYVGSGDGGVYAIDPDTPRVLWRAALGARVRSTPAVSGSTVVVGTQYGYVYGLDRRNGHRIWRFATDGVGHHFADQQNDTTSVFASPTIAGDIVAIGGRDGELYGLDLATGRKRWQTTHDGSSWILSTAAEGGVLYVGSGSAFILQAVDLATGQERWRFPTDSAVFSSLTLVGDAVVFGDLAGTLYAVDRNSGKEYWLFSMGDRMLSTPVVADGVVYATSDRGVLYGLDTSSRPAVNEIKRYVFHADPGPAGGPWFMQNMDQAIVGAFNAQRYQSVDEAALVKAMNEQIEHRVRSVVAFADNDVPAALRNGNDARCLLRRYLEAGGAAVFVSTNPVTFRYDEHGVATSVDETLAAAMLDLHYAPRPNDYGYHVSHVTTNGEHYGLHGYYVTNGAIPDDQVTEVWGQDEFGYASTWLRTYGGDHGGLLIQLAVPRNQISNITPDIDAVELALANHQVD